jgi:hypothetical protein
MIRIPSDRELGQHGRTELLALIRELEKENEVLRQTNAMLLEVKIAQAEVIDRLAPRVMADTDNDGLPE